jgi:hypothetical protein
MNHGPDDPPPLEDPTQDEPVYPEQDTPPGSETAMHAAAGPGEHEVPGEGEDDVDEDDLDPQKPHSPPDAGEGRVAFDENEVVS